MLERSFRGLWAKAAFFEDKNDIDIYVEDQSAESKKLYSMLLSRALNGRVRMDRVYPLGPRNAVLSACERDQDPGGRLRVYIIDGDLELCKRVPTRCLIRLYRLPRYCIENYLVDDRAAAVLTARESVSIDEMEAAEKIDFTGWISANARPLRRLFTAFAAAHCLCPELPTVSRGHSSIIGSGDGMVNLIKVETLLVELRDAVDGKCGRGRFYSEFKRIAREHAQKSDVDFVLQYVSAKDFLLPLLRLRMNSVVRFTKNPALFKLHMAELVEPRELADVIYFAR